MPTLILASFKPLCGPKGNATSDAKNSSDYFALLVSYATAAVLLEFC
jgi:hypothetical protein